MTMVVRILRLDINNGLRTGSIADMPVFQFNPIKVSLNVEGMTDPL